MGKKLGRPIGKVYTEKITFRLSIEHIQLLKTVSEIAQIPTTSIIREALTQYCTAVLGSDAQNSGVASVDQ